MKDNIDALTVEMERARAIPDEELAKKTPPEMLALFEIAYRYHARALWKQIKDRVTDGKAESVLDAICPALMTSYVAGQKVILEENKELLGKMRKAGDRMTTLTWVMLGAIVLQIVLALMPLFLRG